MTLDEIMKSLFLGNSQVTSNEGIVVGQGTLPSGKVIRLLGVVDDTPLGIEGALALAGEVLKLARQSGDEPILLLIDSSSQRMSRHDELLGLSEYLSHLAKALRLAELAGHRSIGLLYGHTAAGAFIATALAAGTLVALPGARPEVMDLPSVARVTKLSIDVLKEKAKQNPVFAPGLEFLSLTGAIAETWDPAASLAEQLEATLAVPTGPDKRAERGKALGGRPKAAEVSARVQALAAAR